MLGQRRHQNDTKRLGRYAESDVKFGYAEAVHAEIEQMH